MPARSLRRRPTAEPRSLRLDGSVDARVLAVNVVHALIPDASGHLDRTAIDKRPVGGAVPVHRLGLAGDQQYDTRHHGGPDQAVYAYAREDAAWWEQELGREIGPGQFGENLTTEGLDVTGAVIGERWRIGTSLLQVRVPRIPCSTFQAYWGVPRLVKRFTRHGAPGAYLSVLEEGELTAGDRVEVVHRPAHGVSLGELFRALTDDASQAPRALDAGADLTDEARRTLLRRSAG